MLFFASFSGSLGVGGFTRQPTCPLANPAVCTALPPDRRRPVSGRIVRAQITEAMEEETSRGGLGRSLISPSRTVHGLCRTPFGDVLARERRNAGDCFESGSYRSKGRRGLCACQSPGRSRIVQELSSRISEKVLWKLIWKMFWIPPTAFSPDLFQKLE